MTVTQSQAAPIGAGFQLDRGDLNFILKQIQISEAHVASRTVAQPCSTLLGTGPNQIPNQGTNGELLPWGLRTVDGSCNNLIAGQEKFGASDQLFPRRVPGSFKAAEPVDTPFDPDGPGPKTQGSPTSYAEVGTSSTPSFVQDSQPRVISNLIVDQTKSNAAAAAASGLTDAELATFPAGATLPIGNVAPDAGLSAPFNAMFTLFGQFFDHGLDLVDKSGGTIYMPLKADDPLRARAGNTPFMLLTRAKTNAQHEATNKATPFVDQNQTYTSHPSHQVFLRSYTRDASTANRPVPNGKLIETVINGEGGMATWATLKAEARTKLGIQLTDTDVLNIPLLATDPYGHFEPGTNGFPQFLLPDGTKVEGNPAANNNLGVLVPANAIRTGQAFLDDIAHHAVPMGDPDGVGGTVSPRPADTDTVLTLSGQPHARDTYDDEMLNAHFVAGDGRVNENIGLTAVHHVFHSEHNRLADNIHALINLQDTAFQNQWRAVNTASGWQYGERLFQAARFVTEMEYQHLVFEEFGRKVQPLINAFGEGGTGYETTTNPAIKAEFAHAVYRFGHSMLTDDIKRTTATGGDTSLDLITAFLNPTHFTSNGATALTPKQGAGQIFRGMTREPGQEIDEFVTETLRNNLLGLPLDLPTINIARARDTGIPTLNEARRAFYAESQNSQVRPYDNWSDVGFNLKHSESLVNFVAAYGRHPSVLNATTLAAKRAAAGRIVGGTPIPVPDDPTTVCTAPNVPVGCDESNPGLPPADWEEFMFGMGAWANTETGVNNIDLWVGGLAEKQMVGGGLLGSTFNYVFEHQMEDLQFADRFYYLARVQGLNLLVQLEGNSFGELVSRNADVSGMPSDIFSRPDLMFNLPNMGPVGGPIVDDATTPDNNEAAQPNLAWQPGGTIRFSGTEHVVFNGRDDVGDRIWSSEGDDTVRGNGGNDWIEGGDGADNIIGGMGDDILNDLNGDDTIKGGPGHDAISNGQGFGGDLNQGGEGQDLINMGNDIAETFAGPDNDFVLGGDDIDTVFGDTGDDWIEGGAGPFNLLQGDMGQAFQNDPDGGHDVIDGDGGEQDMDAEGGDDIMHLGPGIQRAEGMLGFDWTTHKGDPKAANSDMNITVALPPTINDLRDRFDLVEALSGWNLNDTLRGDSREAADFNGVDHSLNAAGIARVAGADALLPAGATGFTGGNILLGGNGNDIIEGRGGNDVIDGDRWLNVKIQAPNPATPAPADTKLVDSIREIQADVFAGRINPGDLRIVRFIENGTPAANTVDTAVFTGPQSEYVITTQPNGSVTVVHNDGGVDGTDTLWRIERLQFADGTVNTNNRAPSGAAVASLNAAGTTLSVATNTIADADGLGTFSFQWQRSVAGGAFTDIGGATSSTLAVTDAIRGSNVRVLVRYTDGAGTAETVTSNAVTLAPAAAVVPNAPTGVTATAGVRSATVRWTPPAVTGGSPITGFQIRIVDATRDRAVAANFIVTNPAATSAVVTGLRDRRNVRFQVRAVNANGVGAWSAFSPVVRPTR
ncbi:peroxidase family protein [Knoellia sinensis]|uniref:peroxidase family protein n=1 Tax=Knoellia sinensis TaxID=136100 RepID=UPI00068B2B9B|nr:peroxidase family protein [Knoellia sinensis]